MQPGFRPLSLPCLIWQEWSHCDLGVGFSVVGGLEPADPRLIGPYQMLGRLGAGGMGRVFLGVSAAGRPVAVPSRALQGLREFVLEDLAG